MAVEKFWDFRHPNLRLRLLPAELDEVDDDGPVDPVDVEPGVSDADPTIMPPICDADLVRQTVSCDVSDAATRMAALNARIKAEDWQTKLTHERVVTASFFGS